MPLRCGGSVTYPTSRQPALLVRTMQEAKTTMMLTVPQALELFMSAIEREVERRGRQRLWHLSLKVARYLPFRLRRLLFRDVHHRFGGCLEVVFSGGAALDPQLGAKWETLGVKVIQGYGTTEASPIISCHTRKRPRSDSAGPPLPGVDVRISEESEILVRGPNVTSGYWQAPEQTAAVFVDGWYRTGDLGFFDQKGFLHIKGRMKDMNVLASGQNVFPEDIEGVLKKHPEVDDAVVVGLPRGSDVEVHAVFLMKEPASAPQVLAWANVQLAEYQRLRGHTVWPEDDFPRTHTLKVKKGEVVEALTDATPKATAAAGPTVNRSDGGTPLVRHLVSQVSGLSQEDLTPALTLGDDLNLDSLNRVELLSVIEQELGVYIDESQLGPATTMAELENLVAQGATATSSMLQFHRWPLRRWCIGLREIIQRAVVFPWMSTMYRCEVSGLENLKTLEGPALFALNHNAVLWDTLVFLKVLPNSQRRRLAIAAAAEITFGQRWLGILASLTVNAFPLSRDTAIRPSLEYLGSLLDRGWSVGIFPEGDQQVGQEMLPFKSGTGLLGVESRTLVVPVRLVSHESTRRWETTLENCVHMLSSLRQFLPAFALPGSRRREKVSIRIGQPLTFPPGTSYLEATRLIEEAVKAL